MQTPQAGWYPDPSDTSRERYWDGVRWSDDVRPRGPALLPAPGAPGNVPPPPAYGSPGRADALQNPDFLEAVKEGLAKFADFKGRSSRRAYWFFYLFSFLVGFVEGLVLGSSISAIVLLIPGLAAAVRRLHDTDRSGWWVLLPFVNLIMLCQRGTAGPNRYGHTPRPTT